MKPEAEPAPSKPRRVALSTLHVHALGAVGVLALAGVAYAFGYAPSARAHQQAELQRQAILKANDEAGATREWLEKARAELASLRERVGTEPDGVDELTDAIAQAATSHGVLEARVSWGEQSVAAGLERSRLLVEGEGSFSDIAGLFAGLQAALPSVAIDGFSMAPHATDEGTLSFHASLSAYAPHPAPAGASASQGASAGAAAGSPVR